MNYAQARQRKDNKGDPIGLWDWTTQNDDVIWCSAPCDYNICLHYSAEEASKHFYNYCLEQATEHQSFNTQKPCIICGKWTSRSFGNIQEWLTLSPLWLCDIHCNKAGLEQASPFNGEISIIHS